VWGLQAIIGELGALLGLMLNLLPTGRYQSSAPHSVLPSRLEFYDVNGPYIDLLGSRNAGCAGLHPHRCDGGDVGASEVWKSGHVLHARANLPRRNLIGKELGNDDRVRIVGTPTETIDAFIPLMNVD
jgi:hypothetical protein